MSAFSSLEHGGAVLAALDELAGSHQPDAIKAGNVNVFELGLWQSWST